MARLNQPAAASGHTILIVDDDPSLLDQLERLLSRYGHRVLSAQNGPSAVEICRRERVHVLLLDYFMPEMTGEEVVREVRLFDQDVQIVLQTGYASERPALETLEELDIQGYHDKSEGPDKMLVWIAAALKAYRRNRALSTSRDGLKYILRATLELYQLQPLEDLMRGVLLQLQGLMGLSGVLVTNRPLDVERSENGFLVTPSAQVFEIRVATGRFEGQAWAELEPSLQETVQSAAATGQVQNTGGLAIPLVAGGRGVGVVLIEKTLQVSPDFDDGGSLELFELLATQAAVALENARLYELATTDDLTRLATRRHWMNRLDDSLRLIARQGGTISVILFDIDHFKSINDTYGHAIGDAVLEAVGALIAQRVRRSDIAGRHGGEEFALACPFTNEAGVQIVAEQLRQAIEGLEVHTGVHGTAIRITASFGVASYTFDASRAGPPRPEGALWRTQDATSEALRRQLLHRADAALYLAKAAGRNCVQAALAEERVELP
jgi:two-component system, cell cycle response regulator